MPFRLSPPSRTDKPASPLDSGEPLRLRNLVTVGLGVVIVFFGAFGGWAALAPLDSAVIAQGVVKVAGERKLVQHLEGGIVAELNVAEGDRVSAGQVLIRLDDTQARARLDLYQGRLHARMALAARLVAERDRKADVAFPEELTGPDVPPSARDAAAAQRSVFFARKRALEGQVIILNQRKLQTEDEITGLEAIIQSQHKLVATIDEEAGELEGLLKKGLTTRERILALRRRQAEIEGDRASNLAAVARARKAITEIEQQIMELSTERLNEAVAELSQVETELFDLEQQIRSAEDVLKRMDIRAPVSGTIVASQLHTTGGVIHPGAPIMEVVPAQDALIVEVEVRPEDVNLVAAGQSAQTRITAFERFDLPAMDGIVQRVSADRLLDERTGVAYFRAVVAIDEDELVKLGGQKLMAGMSAETMIRTGTRTMAGYLAEPLARNFRRAFRED